MDSGTYWKFSAYFKQDQLCVEMYLENPNDERGYPYGNCTSFPRSDVIDMEVARDTTGQPIIYGSVTGAAKSLFLEFDQDGTSMMETVRLYDAPSTIDADVRFFAIPSAASNSVALNALDESGDEIGRVPIDPDDVGPQPWRDPTPASSDAIFESDYEGHHYVVRKWGAGDQTCFEVEFDRSTDTSPAMCTAPSGHALYYTEAAVPDSSYTIVFGAISHGLSPVKVHPDGDGSVDAEIHSTSDPHFDYFQSFFSNGSGSLSGTIATFDDTGVVVEEGPLCPRHVWDKDGGSMCE